MSPEEFSSQMNRLTAQYGTQPYGAERAKLIWEAVGTLSVASWKRIVDRLIGECDRAPLLPKMREMIAEEREHEWATEKREHSKGAQEGWSRLSRGELHDVMETMRRRLMGGMKDDEYASFVRSVNQLGRDE